MHIVYSLEEPPESFSKSIFLAGPTPRSTEVPSWRPQALELLERKNYDGVVYVPENRPGSKETVIPDNGYPKWEHDVMDMSDLILFWLPRDLTMTPGTISDISKMTGPELATYKPWLKLPAYTTNVEFGLTAHSGKALFGPIHGDKNEYLNFVADKFHIPKFHTLEGMLNEALFEILKDGALRTGGEREVPLFLWNTPSFQAWYQSQKKAGNRLDGVKVYWTFKVGKNKEKVFYWAIHPNIHIATENRNKINEAVLSRFDISAVVLYCRRPDILDSEIVLVKEFRSPVRNESGFVWELPGGSSLNSDDPLQTITEEVSEEVGLNIDKIRFKPAQSRQMAATMSTHHGMLYCVELTNDEIEWFKNQKGIPHGADYPDNPTGERAYIEVVKLRDILYNNLVDWPNLGMIEFVLDHYQPTPAKAMGNKKEGGQANA